ncbi:hypothetical protein FRC02_009855 [Tulasnella sp. 418]|nr:hypothetical protein FRC02_009855 [Tulasnella sp. 418]
MVYPDLVMVSDAAKKAYLWDIPSCRLVETLDIPPLNIDERHHAANWEENTVISYVDITRDYIFVCWGAAMVAYPRHQSGCEVDQGSFSVSNSVIIRPEKSLGGMWSDFPCFMVSKSWEAPNERNTLLLTLAPSQRIIKCPDTSAIPWNEDGEFVSVHVSPDGKDLVIITAYPCWLVYVKDFREKAGPDGYKEDRSFRVFLATEEALYTCFDGRRVVLGLGSGVLDPLYTTSTYAITINDLRHASEKSTSLCPTIVSFQGTNQGIYYSSCIQMTKTRIWMSYPYTGCQSEALRLCVSYLDLAES